MFGSQPPKQLKGLSAVIDVGMQILTFIYRASLGRGEVVTWDPALAESERHFKCSTLYILFA